MAWQRANVGVAEHSNDLTITDLETGDTIAVHELCAEKGRTVKNTHHYRDHAQRIVDLEQAIAALIPHETAAALCAVLKRTSPRIYKDQLVAVLQQPGVRPDDSVQITRRTFVHSSLLFGAATVGQTFAW